MRQLAAFLVLIVARLGVAAETPAEPSPSEDESQSTQSQDAYFASPQWKGQSLLGSDRFAELDALVAEYVKADTRGPDGRQALYLLTGTLSEWLERWGEESDQDQQARLQRWQDEIPDSPFQPVVEALRLRMTAWRARGTGYSSSVTPEGWQMFEQRNQKAWNYLMAHKARASTIPTWYEIAIDVGSDLAMDDQELRKVFEEGVRRHPGYYGIYFAYERRFAPRWGGNWNTVDAFIVEQSDARTNTEGDILYARLYWFADQLAGQPPDFFEASDVRWARMRRGFERLLLAFPEGVRNQASFAAFACRANDATTYAKLRPKVDLASFRDVAPDGISIEVCDARFMKKV